MTQCDYTYLFPHGAEQCGNDGTEEVEGSVFCEIHAPVARRSVLDDTAGEVERDMAAWDNYDRETS